MHGLCENMPVSLGSGGIRGVFDLIALMGARWRCGMWMHGGARARRSRLIAAVSYVPPRTLPDRSLTDTK